MAQISINDKLVNLKHYDIHQSEWVALVSHKQRLIQKWILSMGEPVI